MCGDASKGRQLGFTLSILSYNSDLFSDPRSIIAVTGFSLLNATQYCRLYSMGLPWTNYYRNYLQINIDTKWEEVMFVNSYLLSQRVKYILVASVI
jgi:hypothetical protein